MGDSSTAGYLAPTIIQPSSDAQLVGFLQAMVVGLTSISGDMVRPRWQPSPPQQPPATANWAAIGIIEHVADDYPVVMHDPTGNGRDIMVRHETVRLLASFYGPAAVDNAGTLRDGLYVWQNLEPLRAINANLTDATDLTVVPDLVNNQWIYRCDLTVRLRVMVTRVYPVLNILSASGVLETDTSATPFSVTGP